MLTFRLFFFFFFFYTDHRIQLQLEAQTRPFVVRLELSEASLSCICALTYSVILCLRPHVAHLKFRSMLRLKNVSEIMSWKHTDILESNNVQTAPN